MSLLPSLCPLALTLLPFLPPLAVANQQGLYLAKLLNLSKGGAIPDEAKPFRYRHLGSLAYIGGDAAVADFTGTFFSETRGEGVVVVLW